ncbi:MAG: hypothetical protein QY308_04885 [Ignavibacteriaceae bacterium]|nr:MAG: hypothetical protein QY308_04885 [Ignavibacteriaceae bacterium]
MKKFFLMLIVSAGVIFGQSLNVTIQPKYIQGINTGNTNRLPYAYFGTISGLTPNAEYRIFQSDCKINRQPDDQRRR